MASDAKIKYISRYMYEPCHIRSLIYHIKYPKLKKKIKIPIFPNAKYTSPTILVPKPRGGLTPNSKYVEKLAEPSMWGGIPNILIKSPCAKGIGDKRFEIMDSPYVNE